MRTEGQINISINQLADFSIGTDGKKRGIIRQQKKPNVLKVFWYQMAKSRMKKSIAEKGDLTPIFNGIQELKNRTLVNERQINDRNVSLEAMQKFIELRLPTILKNIDYVVVKKSKNKSIFVNGVEVIVSPDLIIKAEIDSVIHYGAIKVHVAKHNQFDSKQQSLVATALHEYLELEFANDGAIVHPELCLSIDIFRGGVVSAPEKIDDKIREMEVICEEVKKLWYAA